MRALRILSFHGGLLLLAAGAAYMAWSDNGEGSSQSGERFEVWGGLPASVTSVEYSGENSSAKVDVRKDDAGQYCLVNSSKEQSKPAGLRPPELQEDEPGKGKIVAKRFISVSGCEKLLSGLAPLIAERAVGMVSKDRYAEFGLDKPAGKLVLKVGGAQRQLTIGGMTPGGGDYYSLVPETGQVFAIGGDLVRLLDYAESRLIERELHSFDPEKAKAVEVLAKEQRTTFVRMEGKVDGWARGGRPDVADETAGNWMSKLGRVRLAEFEEKLLPGTERIVRVEYRGDSKPLGFVEIFRVGEGKDAKYWARSETTRWYGSVLRSTGEQLEQDLAAVAK